MTLPVNRSAKPKVMRRTTAPHQNLAKAGIADVTVQLPGSNTPVAGQEILCAICNNESLLVTNARSGRKPIEAIRQAAHREGWEFDGSGKHIGPRCVKKEKDRKMNAKPKPVGEAVATVPEAAALKSFGDLPTPAVRTADPAQRRRIWRAIEDAYDEANSRYMSGHTDELVAKVLGYPRKWIEDIRAENFGPAGVDPVLVKLETELNALIDRCVAQVDSAMALASAAETLEKAVQSMRQRVEAAIGRGAK